MKRVTRFLALLLCCSLLAGCTTVSDVSAMIDGIGDVTLKSESAIEQAERSYEALPALIRKRVTNYQVLVDARSRYDNIVKTQQELEAAFDAAGTITSSSGATLSGLRIKFNNALTACKPETFSELEQRLTKMEENYTTCLLDEKFAAARALYNEKKYEEAINTANALIKAPKADGYKDRCLDLIDLCEKGIVSQTLAQVQEHLNNKNYYEAMQLLDGVKKGYQSDEYNEIRNGALAILKDNRPKNGAILERTLKSGSNVLKVTAQEGHDFCVTLTPYVFSTNGKVVFYVRGGQTVSIKVPSGTFKLEYSTGEYWYDNTHHFYNGNYYNPFKMLEFKSTSTSYTKITVELSVK